MFLPLEVYGHIIKNVGTTAELYKLLFVSRLVSYEAERVLYHVVDMVAPSITQMLPSWMGLLSHLAHCQRVARHVRELRIGGGIELASLRSAKSEIPSMDEFWYSINQALCSVTNLRSLALTICVSRSRSSKFTFAPSSTFANCTFKLELLTLTSYSHHKIPYLDLSQVKELFLEFRYPLRDLAGITPGALQSLTILSSTASQLLLLGSENTSRIKALNILHTYKAFQAASMFPNVTSLKLSWNYKSNIPHFPSLRYLCILMGNDDTSMDSEPDFTNLHNELAILKDLEKLCFMRARHFDFPAGLRPKLFSTIPSLQELVIETAWDKLERWNRGSRRSVRVKKKSVDDEWKDARWQPRITGTAVETIQLS